MDTALEAMRKTELKCKELETRCKAVEQRKTDFVETSRRVESPTPLILNNLSQNTETEAEYINKTEALNNTLAALKTEIDEKKAENVFLKNEISLNQTDRNRDSIADETSEAEDISLKLALAAGRDTAPPREEKGCKKLSADKKLLYVTSPKDTESGSQFSGKMIYTAPATDIKKESVRNSHPVCSQCGRHIAGILIFLTILKLHTLQVSCHIALCLLKGIHSLSAATAA